MIINIPLQIDDEMINNVIAKDYQAKIEANLTKQVEEALKRNSRSYSRTVSDGLYYLAIDAVDKVIDEYKDEIIERAGSKLAERLAKTKRGKEILEEATNDRR